MMKWDRVIGTGGIGKGILYHFDDNRMIDRNESRLADLSEARDYCKQHIILHYIAVGLSPDVRVQAVGMVGNDPDGQSLLSQMRDTGIDTQYVLRTDEAPTMFSVCMQYPDKAVCNVTSGNSACALVSPEYIHNTLAMLETPLNRRDMVLAAPEVGLSARKALLEAGKKAGAFCIASFTSTEAQDFLKSEMLASTDLLSVNEEEALALLGKEYDHTADLFAALQTLCRSVQPQMQIIMTCGGAGSHIGTGTLTKKIEAMNAAVRSTAGAGDAYLAGTVCALCMGIPFMSEEGFCASELGAYFACLSVQDIHTITQQVTKQGIAQYLRERNVSYV